MKRLGVVLVLLLATSGCLGASSTGEEINHDDGDLTYLGTTENHEVAFDTIDYVSRETSNDTIRIDFGREIPPRTRVIITFYNDGVYADRLRHDIGQADGEVATVTVRPANLTTSDGTADFTGYDVRVVQVERSPNVGPDDPQPPERCEDENVAPESDAPMTPNCDTNPYD